MIRKWFLITGAVFFGIAFFSGQQFDQEKQHEAVTVTAVEVPVRVFRKGEVVKGLSKEDFEVYENSVRQEIVGFDIVSRRISRPSQLSGITVDSPRQPRYFLLIFDIFDYTDAIGDAIDYFFDRVYEKNDGILIMTENQILNVEQNENPQGMRSNIKSTLRKYKSVSLQHIYKAYLEVQDECDRAIRMLGDERRSPPPSWDQFLNRFFDNYESIWKAYRDRFLVPNFDLYRLALRRIASIDADKWAICFQQRDLFPQLRSFGTLEQKISSILIGQIEPEGQAKAQILRAKQQRLRELLAMDRRFPADQLKDLFAASGLTYHLILMKSAKPLASLELELSEVGEGYEAIFKDISLSTGGFTSLSNRAVEALQEALAQEDYHYVLAYQSQAPVSMRGKSIKVKVLRDRVDVRYLKHAQRYEGPAITIEGVVFNHGALSFVLRNYAMGMTEKGVRGAADIRIVLADGMARSVVDERKSLELIKEEAHFSKTLPRLKAGTYLLTIEVLDKITSEKDVYVRILDF